MTEFLIFFHKIILNLYSDLQFATETQSSLKLIIECFNSLEYIMFQAYMSNILKILHFILLLSFTENQISLNKISDKLWYISSFSDEKAQILIRLRAIFLFISTSMTNTEDLFTSAYTWFRKIFLFISSTSVTNTEDLITSANIWFRKKLHLEFQLKGIWS